MCIKTGGISQPHRCDYSYRGLKKRDGVLVEVYACIICGDEHIVPLGTGCEEW